MPGPPFVDTNIFVRHLAGDHTDHSPRATAYLARVQSGEITAQTSNTVIFETLFVCERLYRLSRQQIRDTLLPIVQLDNLIIPERRQIVAAFELYMTHAALSFADCYHVVLVDHLDLSGIVSFDRGYDRIPDLIRIEP